MSDSSRRRTTTKTTERASDAENKQAREELRRLHERADDSPRPASGLRRSWEKFDDLPEHRRRTPLPSNTSAPRAAQTQRREPVEVPVPRAEPRPARPMLDEPEYNARSTPIARSHAHLREAELLHESRWSSLPPPPFFHETQRMPWILALIIIASVTIISVMYMRPAQTYIGTAREPAPNVLNAPAQPVAPAPNGEHSLVRPPSLTAEQIDTVLREYNSPAAGTGRDWVELGQKYNIDPAYALAFFVVESTAGTAQGWAGWKPDGTSTHNIGNIICAGYDTCYGRFRDYRSWQEGIEDWYKLISVEYVDGRGLQTIEQIIPIYAPAFENDVDAYVNNVERMVTEWRAK